MNCALIITTYNWKEALEMTLLSVENQTRLPDEIIIADDGSRPDTVEFIQHYQKHSSLNILHSWQEDKGFRLSLSRNLAVKQSTSDYLIFIDGDLILEPHFVEDHMNHASHSTYLQGTRVLLTKKTSKKIIEKKDLRFLFFRKGIKNRKNTLRSTLLSKIFSKTTTSPKGIRGCNFSISRKNYKNVNGFNNDFIGWGREDSEFVCRLNNSGIIRKNLKFCALTQHIYHPESDRLSLKENDIILEDCQQNQLTWCHNGLRES